MKEDLPFSPGPEFVRNPETLSGGLAGTPVGVRIGTQDSGSPETSETPVPSPEKFASPPEASVLNPEASAPSPEEADRPEMPPEPPILSQPPVLLPSSRPRPSRRLLPVLLLLAAMAFVLTRPEASAALAAAADTAALSALFTYGLDSPAASVETASAPLPDTALSGLPDPSGTIPRYLGQAPELLTGGTASGQTGAVQTESNLPEPAQPPETGMTAAALPPEGAGVVREVRYQGGENYLALDPAGYLRNATRLAQSEVQALLTTPSAVSLTRDGSPEVLLICTHTTEAYEPADVGWYDPGYASRSENPEENMLAVADAMAERLRAAGVGVIVDRTLFDFPAYEGAYDRSREAIRGWLETYPTLRVVLDVHRDALESEGERLKPTAVVKGEKTAQIMLIAGCDNGSFQMPDWAWNLRFAAAFQTAMEEMWPGMTRPVLFDYRKYNQDLSVGALLMEVGGHGNTLEEAKRAAVCAAEALLTL